MAAAVIDMLIGMSYGLISGYFGGKVDMLMQRFLEVANGIPVWSSLRCCFWCCSPA